MKFNLKTKAYVLGKDIIAPNREGIYETTDKKIIEFLKGKGHKPEIDKSEPAKSSSGDNGNLSELLETAKELGIKVPKKYTEASLRELINKKLSE